MTIENAQKDFNELIEKNGFTPIPYAKENITIYHKEWKKTSQVVWYGEHEETLVVRILLSYGIPLVSVMKNGKQDPKFIRNYSSPKRAMRAIKEIVRCAGFEW